MDKLADKLDYYWRYLGAGGEGMKEPDYKLSDLLQAAAEIVAEYDMTGRSLYCTDCGSCGEPGCCPPSMCNKAAIHPRIVVMLDRLKADAVVSKFATSRECMVYRQAVDDMLTMIRATPEKPCPRCYGYGPEADCPVCKGTGSEPQGESHKCK